MNLRDRNILLGLWKWKFLSTSAITEIYCADLEPSSAYNRLLNLRGQGLITVVSSDGNEIDRHFLWALSQKGFKAIREPNLAHLKEEGYKSEAIEHDHLVTAAHIGGWIKGIPENCALFSEQQLRRYHEDQYDSWVPKLVNHRPDGYWRFFKNGKSGTAALEVELSQKPKTKYQTTVAAFDLESKIYRVIWIVRFKGIAELIHSVSQSITSGNKPNFAFIYEKDFKTYGWNAKVFLGRDVGHTLANILGTDVTPQGLVTSMSLLDTRKCPHRSQFYTKSSKSPISHRLSPLVVNVSLTQNLSVPNITPNKGETTNE